MLGGSRKAVQEECREHENVHQHGVGGERHRAEPGPDLCHQGEGAAQDQGADENVRVELEELLQLEPVEEVGPGRTGCARKPAHHQKEADGRSRYFGRGRPPGDPGHAPAEPQAENDRKEDVRPVEEDLQRQAEPCLSTTEHETEDGVVDEGRRTGKDANGEILADHGLHPGFVGHQFRRAPQDDRRKGKHQDAEGERAEARTPEYRLKLPLVFPAEGLRGKSRRRRPEEAEAAIDEIEEDCGDRQARQGFGLSQSADDGRVCQPEQRRRQKAERHRHRNRKHQPMGDREGTRDGIRCLGGGFHQAESTMAQ